MVVVNNIIDKENYFIKSFLRALKEGISHTVINPYNVVVWSLINESTKGEVNTLNRVFSLPLHIWIKYNNSEIQKIYFETIWQVVCEEIRPIVNETIKEMPDWVFFDSRKKMELSTKLMDFYTNIDNKWAYCNIESIRKVTYGYTTTDVSDAIHNRIKDKFMYDKINTKPIC